MENVIKNVLKKCPSQPKKTFEILELMMMGVIRLMDIFFGLMGYFVRSLYKQMLKLIYHLSFVVWPTLPLHLLLLQSILQRWVNCGLLLSILHSLIAEVTVLQGVLKSTYFILTCFCLVLSIISVVELKCTLNCHSSLFLVIYHFVPKMREMCI